MSFVHWRDVFVHIGGKEETAAAAGTKSAAVIFDLVAYVPSAPGHPGWHRYELSGSIYACDPTEFYSTAVSVDALTSQLGSQYQ